MLSKILLFPAIITMFVPTLSTRMNVFIRAASVCVECPPDTCSSPCSGNSICVETKKQSCYKCPKYKCLSSEATSTEDIYPETPESSAYFEETESFYPETLDFTREETQTEEFSNETPDSSTFTTGDLIPTYPPHKDDNASCVVCTQQTCSDPCPYAAMVCVDVRKQTCKKCAKWECVALANTPANSTGGLSMSTPTI